MKAPVDPMKVKLLEAILPHVAFDGWAQSAFETAVQEVGIDPAHARTLCPRGPVDLAVFYHERGDAAMVEALKSAQMHGMRFRDKVAHAVRLRLEAVDDKEIARRGTALFALPHLAPIGATLLWGTADSIWTALGDTSDDVNWYTKRATLSGVYAAVVLFWLGDTSEDAADTDAFIDRRIGDVMQIEKVKASVRESKVLGPVVGPLEKMLGLIKAPRQMPMSDLPGMWRDPE